MASEDNIRAYKGDREAIRVRAWGKRITFRPVPSLGSQRWVWRDIELVEIESEHGTRWNVIGYVSLFGYGRTPAEACADFTNMVRLNARAIGYRMVRKS